MDELAPQHGVSLPVRPSQQSITLVNDCAGHYRRYSIDANKIEAELGWRPEVSVQEGLRHTVAWYLTHQEWWQLLLALSGRV
jgi:dTDP-glucose 4,6-dehydratase